MAEIIIYNGFEVEVGSPTYKRLVSEREHGVSGFDPDDAERVTVEVEGEEESTDYSKLKVSELDELLEKRDIDASGASNKAEKVALLEQADAEAAEGETLS